MGHVSKADPGIGEEDEDGAAKEVDQHQVESTLSNNNLMLNLWCSVLYLAVRGGGIGSDDDEDWTESEAGGQGGPRAALAEEEGCDGSEGKGRADPDVLSKDCSPSPGYYNVDPCCSKTWFRPPYSKHLHLHHLFAHFVAFEEKITVGLILEAVSDPLSPIAEGQLVGRVAPRPKLELAHIAVQWVELHRHRANQLDLEVEPLTHPGGAMVCKAHFQGSQLPEAVGVLEVLGVEDSEVGGPDEIQCFRKWNLVLRTWGQKLFNGEKKDFWVKKGPKKDPL